MSIKNESVYPNCVLVSRTIQVGGLTKHQLLQKFRDGSISVNKLGERLFADERFTTSNKVYALRTVELTVRDLGFLEGAVIKQIFETAQFLGLSLCPVELGPYFRLSYLDQPEGDLGGHSGEKKAPFGSVTIASNILSEDDDFPKGFYLRRIKGELWLRGYIADDLHIWSPSDRFIFCQTEVVD